MVMCVPDIWHRSPLQVSELCLVLVLSWGHGPLDFISFPWGCLLLLHVTLSLMLSSHLLLLPNCMGERGGPLPHATAAGLYLPLFAYHLHRHLLPVKKIFVLCRIYMHNMVPIGLRCLLVGHTLL